MLNRLSRRGHGAAAISACLCACLAAASNAQDQNSDESPASATANGGAVIDVAPFTLDGATTDPVDDNASSNPTPPVSIDSDDTDDPDDPVDTAESSDAPAEPSAEDDADAAPFGSTTDDRAVWQPPAREQLGLGTPSNGNPLAGTVDELTDGDGKGSPFAAIDPRTNDLVRVVLALGFVLGIIFTLRRFIQMRGGGLGQAGQPSGVLEVLARYPIARGQQLMVLKMGRRVLLVHHAGENMTPITDVSDNDEVASLLARIEAGSNAKATPRFGSMLESLNKGTPATNARPANVVARDGVVDLTRRQATGGIGRLLLPRKAGS